MAKKKIIIYTFTPNWRQGGVMVMHYFSKILSDMGEDVYLTVTDTKLPDDKSKILKYEDALVLAQSQDAVVLYPEVIAGNPMNAKNVARWVLYYPGGHGGGDLVYHPSELVFPFFERYVKGTPHENCPLLTIVQTRLNQFFPMNMERKFDCVLIKKAYSNFEYIKQKHFNQYEHLLGKQIIVLDKILDQIQYVEQLNEVFNQVRYFVSFDQATYYSIMASLSGCTSIVLPIDGLTKEQWIEQMPTYKYGVAYGFDDASWSTETREQLKGLLQETEKENLFYAEQFVKLINERFAS